MFGMGVTYLFGTTPFAMMCLQGDLAVTVDERALEIFKMKPTGQRLSVMPAQMTMSDEAYLLRLMDMKESGAYGDLGVDGIIGMVWRYIGAEMKVNMVGGPFSLSANVKTKDCNLKDLIKLLA